MALSNAQYDALIRRYEAKQLEGHRKAEDRAALLYQKLPRLAQLDDAISSASVRQAKKLLDGDDGALARLREEIQSLTAQKQSLLAENGYPEGYLDPVYECPDCKDTGYVGNEKCHCFRQAEIDLVYAQSNIRPVLEEENFSNFSYQYYSESEINPSTGQSGLETARQAVALCRDFIDTFGTEFKNLFFYGDTGTGKTFLTHCVAKELLDAGRSVLYFTAPALFRVFEKNTFGRESADGEDYRNIFGCDFLIIDDLGTELTNSFTSSQLFQCLNERILRRKPTAISTNLGLGQIVERYSERIFSRISSNYSIIKLFGSDIRIQKKLKRH